MVEQRSGRFSGSRVGRSWSGRRYVPRRKVCYFCVNKIKTIDYKDPAKLRPYLTDRGKIAPRRKTGVCAKHQRVLTIAIKRARHLALLPCAPAHVYNNLSSPA